MIPVAPVPYAIRSNFHVATIKPDQLGFTVLSSLLFHQPGPKLPDYFDKFGRFFLRFWTSNNLVKLFNVSVCFFGGNLPEKSLEFLYCQTPNMDVRNNNNKNRQVMLNIPPDAKLVLKNYILHDYIWIIFCFSSKLSLLTTKFQITQLKSR